MKKIQHPKLVATTLFTSFLFIAMIMFSAMGGMYFAQAYPKALNYANSMCQVNTREYKSYDCPSRYVTYTCYGPIWKVHHGLNRTIYAIVEVTKRYRSYAKAINKANEYQLDMIYSCWYDTRNPSVAQWDKPNVLFETILLSCGGLSALLFITFFFLTRRFIEEKKIQNEHDKVYSYSNPAS